MSTLSCQHRPSVALKTFTALSIRPWIRLSPAAFHWVWQFYRYYRRCLSWTSKMSPDVVIQRVQLGWIYRPYFFCSEIRAAVSQPVVRAIVGHWCCGHARFLSTRKSTRRQPRNADNFKTLNARMCVQHRRRRRGGSRFQVGVRKYLSAPQVLSLKNTNKEALSTPQPLSSNYHEWMSQYCGPSKRLKLKQTLHYDCGLIRCRSCILST